MAPEPAGSQRGSSSTRHPARTMGQPVVEVVLFFPKGLFFQSLILDVVSDLGAEPEP